MATNVTKGTVLKKGDTFTDTAGRTGTVAFDTKTGKALKEGGSTKALSSGGTVAPAIITSKTAEKDLNNIKTNVADINTGITNQATRVATETAQASADKTIKDEAAAQAKIAADKAKIDQQNADTKTAALTGSAVPTAPAESADQKKLRKLEEDYDTQATNVSNTIKNIQNGTIPLNAGEQAQVAGLQQQFQTLIDQQKLTNTGAAGTAQIRGYQTGSAEYDNAFQTNIIGSIVTAGMNKIADLNIKMASAVAELTQGFKTDNIKAIKDSWEVYSTAADKRADVLQNTINNAQKAIKDAQDAKEAADKAYQDNVLKPIQELAKNAKTMGASSEVIEAILQQPDLNSAYTAAGDYAAGGTGMIGEYNYYVSQMRAAGKTPSSFTSYQNEDANRKAKIAAAANASGLTTAAMNTALKLSDDYEARSKDFYAQREAYNRIVSSAADPSAAGDLALIFNYMKVLDPNSTVREGEFATAQNSGSAFSIVGAKYNKIVNGERLTEGQRADFVDRATRLFQGAKTQQDAVASEFKERSTKYGVPADLVVRGTEATGSKVTDAIKDETNAENKLHAYITKNPNMAATIDKKIKDVEAKLGKKLSAMEFLQAYPEYNQ